MSGYPFPYIQSQLWEGPAPGKPDKPRNPIWDTLAAIFGEPTTRTNTRLRGRICASLTEAGATPDEIVDRARSWPYHFPKATLTETALEKHWDRLGRPPLRAPARAEWELERHIRRQQIMGGTDEIQDETT